MKTHWLSSPNKNYLGHWDLPDGTDFILTIKSAKWEEVKNPVINKTESKRVIRFQENVKPFICNQINANSIMKSTCVKFMEDSPGKKITLFVGAHKDNSSGEWIDCLRVRHNSEIKKLPELEQNSTNFNKAITYLSTGGNIGAIEKKYTLTKEVREALLNKSI